jgi:light-regulated signal transduction histidine kinase (bacteriophytochrome)
MKRVDTMGYSRAIRPVFGRTMDVLYNATKCHNAAGPPPGACASARDVTERMRAEAELETFRQQLAELVEQRTSQLQRTTEDLIRSNKELEQFASVVSHDLQEPLRTVRGFVQLLQRKYGNRLDAEADTFIEFAVDGTNRMETLIKDLLAYARVTTRNGELVPTDAGAALRQALGNLHASIQETGAEITHRDLPVVQADPAQLVQLFQNLLGNALKFHGDAPPKIDVDACQERGYWRFLVRDNGIGIDSRFQEHIFEMFRRLDTRTQYAGSGIGLAICKNIAHRHGGRIWVESELGRGATFNFTIPRR